MISAFIFLVGSLLTAKMYIPSLYVGGICVCTCSLVYLYTCACGEQRSISGSLMTVTVRCNLKFCIQHMVIARLRNKKDI